MGFRSKMAAAGLGKDQYIIPEQKYWNKNQQSVRCTRHYLVLLVVKNIFKKKGGGGGGGAAMTERENVCVCVHVF